MDELDLKFIDEAINMRLEIAYKRKCRNQSHEEAEQEREVDDKIDELYDKIIEQCTDEGKKVLHEYSDEIAYRESNDADFYYKSGFLDGVALMQLLQKH